MVHKVTVLISGSGSNLQSLIDACASGRLELKLIHVISNREQAVGLERARAAGIPCSLLPHEGFASREDFDCALALLIATHSPDLVILAGFMRILGAAVLNQFSGRMINLHPSLLPLYRGTDTYRRVLADGASEHGASMHFVTAELDGGPIISQVRIPIEAHDNPHDLAERLAPREHDLVVATAELFSRCSVECINGEIFLDGKRLEHPLQLQANGSFTN